MRLSRNFKLGTVVVLCLLMVFASCVSASAEVTYTTKTEYTGTSSDSKVTVTATVANVAENDIVTYVAHTGDKISAGSIVYLDQVKSDSTDNGTITFEYSTNASNLNQTKLFGGREGGAGKYPVYKSEDDKSGYYLVTIVAGGELTPTSYVPYGEGVTPYNVAREFSVNKALGSVTKISVADDAEGTNATEITNYIINNEGKVTMYTDAISETGLYIIVETDGSPAYKAPVLGGVDETCTIQAKSDYVLATEYGVVVSTDDSFSNIVPLTEGAELANGTAIAFPALGKNSDGIFAVQFTGLSDGTYHFAAYQKTDTGYDIDTIGVDDKTASLTIGTTAE